MLETSIEVLEKCAQLVTTPEEWGYESVTMEKEEIEMGMLPEDVTLPRLVMTHLYIYCAPEDGKDYVVYFITDYQPARICSWVTGRRTIGLESDWRNQ